jgi:hypothetical protein
VADRLEDYYKFIDEISSGHKADIVRIRTSLAHVELAEPKRNLVNELLNYVQDLENYQSKTLKFMIFTADVIGNQREQINELRSRIKETESVQEDFNTKSNEYDQFMTEVKDLIKARADTMQELEKEKFDSELRKS